VHAAWPVAKPLAVALNCDDCAPDGFTEDEAVEVAAELKARGCALLQVLAGHSIPEAVPTYSRGFLTRYSDRIRNEVGIATLVGGYLTTMNEVNTIVAAGRADLCILTPSAR
jgi:anthraniloyl-CoA monooxygenase